MDSEDTFRHRLKDAPSRVPSDLSPRIEEECHTLSVRGGRAGVQDGSAMDVCYSTTRPTRLRLSEKIHVPGLHSVNNGTQLSTLIS